MSPVHRFLPFVLLFAPGCSAPERANRAPRCEVQSDCADGRVCYRGFCVTDDPVDPPVDSDDDPSTADASEPPPAEPAQEASTGEPPPVDASSPRDAAPPMQSEASVPPPTRDAEAEPPIDAAPMGPPDPPVVVDSGSGPSVEDATVPPPPPPPDGGPMNNDDLQRDLGVCLVRCRNNEAICYNCFRRIVQQHPEVCTASNPIGVDALVQNLCGLLCPTPSSCAPGPGGGR